MTRMSKQARVRAISYKRPRLGGPKTGPKKDQLEQGFRVHENALNESMNRFITKVSQ